MALTDPRLYYKPFEYPQAFEYFEKQHRVHWLASEVPLASDLSDWNSKLTPSEKNLIGNILKSFTQTEIHVNEYWSGKVAVWFPKFEIQAAARAMADFESIHAQSYARLNEELGLDDFQAFLEDESAKSKIDRLIETPGNTLREKALSLAIFSAFTEGVNLFSSFAVLMSFQLRNLLKGTGQIVEYSVRDESLHSEFGCYLFRTLMEENPELNTKEFEQEIYDACDLSIKLEFDFIDKAFEMGEIANLNKKQLKNYILERANQKLLELGYQPLYSDIDQELLNQMSWFGSLTRGKSHTDFFASTSTDYSLSTADWGDL